MPTRKLNEAELLEFNSLLADVRRSIERLGGNDPSLVFAFRRKLAKELTYDERGKPTKRRQLKMRRFRSQAGKCAECGKDFPQGGKGAVLDRLEAMSGYTKENTRLICRPCDERVQESRGYRG